MAIRNPFEFGRVLGSDEIVDREEEIATVRRTVSGNGKLFLIGPRRYGKSSVLKAAAELEAGEGAIVLRFDVEKYESLDALARAMLVEATRELTGGWERAVETIGRFFGALSPRVTVDPATGEIGVGLGSVRPSDDGLPTLVEVLDGIEAMAREDDRRVAVVLDEFQHVATDEPAERRIRATIQEHGSVAYVFAGSQTTLLTDMTGHPDRPFYRLGERLFLGPVDRPTFRTFIEEGFADGGFTATEEAVEAILDRADDVPFNVQQLAHYAWEEVRGAGKERLDPVDVEAALDRLVRNEDPFYTHLWTRLSSNQRRALRAVAETRGVELYGRSVTERYGLSASAMQSAARDLVRHGLVREVQETGAEGVRLVDPFFVRWLDLARESGS